MSSVDDVNLEMSTTGYCEEVPMNVEELKDRGLMSLEFVRSLMYACLTTRPDICAAVNLYSQFQTDATEVQRVSLNRVLRYLTGTLDLGLWFKGIGDVPLLGYADAHFANRPDRKTVTGYIFEMYGDAVCWQLTSNTVVLSTTESEFVALASATVELLWLMQLFTYLGIELCKPITVFEDNQSCICAAGSWEQKCLKHIDIKYKFIYIPSAEQKADMLTKGWSKIPISQDAPQRVLSDMAVHGEGKATHTGVSYTAPGNVHSEQTLADEYMA
ncbi:hypothetical protein PR048_018778 [Dryococelus australis]|uniref:Uncharacterized protein n=1 Tax=Dryococelus australis TaxID=614101 RepID=A0ABQ9HDE0_9NEOP|nr:hypothetical protein PR048_018778 [Dryococelus australis]